jgi:hypothetical protein
VTPVEEKYMQQMLYRKLEYFKEVLDLARLALACTFLCQAVKRHSQAHKLLPFQISSSGRSGGVLDKINSLLDLSLQLGQHALKGNLLEGV